MSCRVSKIGYPQRKGDSEVKIQTSRFGAIEISQDDLIDFPEGPIGFQNLRSFVLLDDPNDEIFAWLQSCEDAAIAFPVLEPELFRQDYKLALNKHDLESLKAPSGEGLRCFCIITIPNDPTQMTANLKAPVVINVAGRVARQCVLQDNHLAIREPIFALLQQRVVQNPGATIKSQAHAWGVAHRLPDAEL